METVKKHKKKGLETRLDLFKKWIISDWFEEKLADKDTDNDIRFQQKLFKLWLELFMALYGDLTEKVSSTAKRDSIFIYFVNEVFTNAIDNYKWYESEKKGNDIGLLEALEHVSVEDWYIELLSKFSQIY